MNDEQLIEYLKRVNHDPDFVITFSDGDGYRLMHVDINGSFDTNGELESLRLDVEFKHCLKPSKKQRLAWDAGRLQLPEIWYTSVNPYVPVGASYKVHELMTIFDESKNYFVYQRQTPYQLF